MTPHPRPARRPLLSLALVLPLSPAAPEERIPLLGRIPVPLGGPSATVGSPEAPTKLHRDPESGFQLRTPPSWTVRSAEDRLWLQPPSTSPGDGPDPALRLFVSGEPAPGLERLDDPRVLAFLDRVAASLLPGAGRDGSPTTTQSGTPRLRVRWVCEEPAPRRSVRLWGWFAAEHLVCLVAVGPTERLDALDATLEAIFATFGFEEETRDPRLVGTWKTSSYTFGTDFNRYLILAPDGRCFQATTLDSDFVPGPANAEDRGTWFLRGGQLVLRWQKDGTVRHDARHDVTEFGTYLHFGGDRWRKVR